MMIDARTGSMADAVRPRVNGRIWDIALVVAFGMLMGAFAQVSIPLPFTPVPLSGQTLGVILAGALLGSRRGFAAMMVYLAEGIAGLPVFALGHAGWATIVGPTGGYLVAFPLAAFVVGLLAERGWDRSVPQAAVAMLAGEVVTFAIGVGWLAHFVGWSLAISLGLTPFLIGDGLKVLLAALVLPSGWALLRGMRMQG